MSLGHPWILLRPSWRRDVKSPLVVLRTYCGNYVIDVYSYYDPTTVNIRIKSIKSKQCLSKNAFPNIILAGEMTNKITIPLYKFIYSDNNNGYFDFS